jgi:hypothetical protein
MQRKFSFRGLLGLAAMLALLCVTMPLSFAQSSSNINWTRMQRDLDIMESVLNKLLTPSSPAWGLWGGKTRGVYFEGYGVVFQVNYGGHQLYVLSDRKLSESLQQVEKKLRQVEKKLSEVNPRQESEDVLVLRSIDNLEEAESETDMAERLENLKEQLTEFFGNYADAIGQLKDSDRITVLVNLGNDHTFNIAPLLSQRITSNQISLLEATVKKSDIIEFRRGRINENEFRTRVSFSERSQNSNAKKSLDIMAEIMEKALSRKYHNDFGAENISRGIRLEGLGVLFFMKGVLDDKMLKSPINFYLDKYLGGQEVKIIKKDREQKSKKRLHELLDGFKNALVEVVGDYGHTLRSLQPTEYVVVAVDFNAFWSPTDDQPNRFIMKVQKKHLDQYNRGDIELAEFRNKVKFLEY